MRLHITILSIFFSIFSAQHLRAQPSAAVSGGQAGIAGMGVTPVRQIDRPEVRVSRVELAVGAVRAVHQHDEAKFHLFIPLTGTLELTIGSDKPVVATPGQAFFLLKGTPHSFRNIGSTPASVMEVFVLLDKPAIGEQAPSAQNSAEEVGILLQSLEAVLPRSPSKGTTKY